MDKKENTGSTNKEFCEVCKLEQEYVPCDYCGEKGSRTCAKHWECQKGGSLVYAENLPWFSHGKPGFYCFNCAMPPH